MEQKEKKIELKKNLLWIERGREIIFTTKVKIRSLINLNPFPFLSHTIPEFDLGLKLDPTIDVKKKLHLT